MGLRATLMTKDREGDQWMDENHLIMDEILEAGRIILENGSEIYRAEQTMIFMAKSFNFEDINIFTLSTCIYATMKKDGEVYTRIKRAYPKTTNLAIISRINQLSRDMVKHPLSLEEMKNKLDEIEAIERYPRLFTAVLMSLSCAVFSYMLCDCSWMDFIVTSVIVFMAYYLLEFITKWQLHTLIKNALVTVFMTFCAVLCKELGLPVDIDHIVIGAIMLVIPGVALTNAIRDGLNGDILSGTIRLVEAITIAIGIVIGAGVVLLIYYNGWVV